MSFLGMRIPSINELSALTSEMSDHVLTKYSPESMGKEFGSLFHPGELSLSPQDQIKSVGGSALRFGREIASKAKNGIGAFIDDPLGEALHVGGSALHFGHEMASKAKKGIGKGTDAALEFAKNSGRNILDAGVLVLHFGHEMASKAKTGIGKGSNDVLEFAKKTGRTIFDAGSSALHFGDEIASKVQKEIGAFIKDPLGEALHIGGSALNFGLEIASKAKKGIEKGTDAVLEFSLKTGRKILDAGALILNFGREIASKAKRGVEKGTDAVLEFSLKTGRKILDAGASALHFGHDIASKVQKEIGAFINDPLGEALHIGGSALRFGRKMFSKAKTGVGKGADGVLEFSKKTGRKILGAGDSALRFGRKMFSKAKTGIGKGADAAWKFSKKTGRKILGVGDSALRFGRKLFSKAKTGVGKGTDAVLEFSKRTGRKILGVGDSALHFGHEMASEAKKEIGAFKKDPLGEALHIGGSALHFGREIASKAKTGIGKGTDAVLEFSKRSGRKILGAGDSALHFGHEMASKAKTGIGKGTDAVLDFSKKTGRTILGAGDSAFHYGSEMASKSLRGIGNGIGEVFKFAKDTDFSLTAPHRGLKDDGTSTVHSNHRGEEEEARDANHSGAWGVVNGILSNKKDHQKTAIEQAEQMAFALLRGKGYEGHKGPVTNAWNQPTKTTAPSFTGPKMDSKISPVPFGKQFLGISPMLPAFTTPTSTHANPLDLMTGGFGHMLSAGGAALGFSDHDAGGGMGSAFSSFHLPDFMRPHSASSMATSHTPGVQSPMMGLAPTWPHMSLQPALIGQGTMPGATGMQSLDLAQQTAGNFDQFVNSVDPGGLASDIQKQGGPGQPLPTIVRGQMEHNFGTGFDDVKIHTDPSAASAAQGMGAKAFAIGSDIYFGPGQYKPGTQEGQGLLAHELTHVVQQTGGSSGLDRAMMIGERGAGPQVQEREAQRTESTYLRPRMSPRFGGVHFENYENEYVNSSGDPLSPEETTRLDGIGQMALRRVQETFQAADQDILELPVDVEIDLSVLNDAEAAEVWAQAITGELRRRSRTSHRGAAEGTSASQPNRPVIGEHRDVRHEPEHNSHRQMNASQGAINRAAEPDAQPTQAQPPTVTPMPIQQATSEVQQQLYTALLLKDPVFVKAIKDFTGISEPNKIQLINILVNQRWVGYFDEKAIERIWATFPDIAKVARENSGLYKKCTDKGAKLDELPAVQSKRGIFIPIFEARAKHTAGGLLQKSLDIIREETKRYGLGPKIEPGAQYSSGWGMQENEANKGLMKAAKELAPQLSEIARLRKKLRETTDRIMRNANRVGIQTGDWAKIEAIETVLKDKQRDYDLARQRRERAFPILAAFTSVDQLGELEKIAKGTKDKAAAALGEQIDEKMKNIEKVQKALNSGELKIWNQSKVIHLTKALMGTGDLENAWIDNQVANVTSDEMLGNLFKAAIAIALGILAAIPTGGSSLVAGIATAAAVGGAAISAEAVYESAKKYQLESAAAGTAFDKAKAISEDDPSLFWLALDIVAAVVDLGAAVRAFKMIAPAARLARNEKALKALESTLREQGEALSAERKLGEGMTVEAFVRRGMESAEKSVVEMKAVRATLAKQLTDGTHPDMKYLLEGITGGTQAETAMLDLLKDYGNWKLMMETLEGGSPSAMKVGEKLLEYRTKIQGELGEKFGATLLGKPSTKLISDVDLSMNGLDAGKKLIEAEAFMARRYGEGWEEMLRMNFYTEGGRLTKYTRYMEEMDPAARKLFQGVVSGKTEELVVTKMLEHAGDDASAIARVEAKAKSMGVTITRAMRKMSKVKEADRIIKRNQLLLELDDLSKAHEAATGASKAELAKQITFKQMEANFYSVEANIGPGSIRILQKVQVVGQEAYQTAVTQLEMIEHVISQAGGDVAKAAREYELYKYMSRFVEGAERAGVKSAQLTEMKVISDYIYISSRYSMKEWALLGEQGAKGVADAMFKEGASPENLKKMFTKFDKLVEETLPKIKAAAAEDAGKWAPRTEKEL